MADVNRNSLIDEYFVLGFSDKDIQFVLHHEHSLDISIRQIKRIRKRHNLSGRQYSDPRDVVEFVQAQLREAGQLHGYRVMHAKCLVEGLRVRMEDIRMLLKQLDPVGVQLRQQRRLRRRAYHAEGPNFIWHVDGYDKLKPFGLAIHGCICGFSREIIWLNAYRTNNNPRIIGGYFIDAVTECKGCPRIVRSDYGTENGHMRDFQAFLRRDGQDPQATRCFIDGASTANERIEMWWGYLRRESLHVWIEHFRALLDRGDFTGTVLDKSLVQFCFMGILQTELDTVATVWNNHPIRPSRNARVPFGRPIQMYHIPGLWGATDKLCDVSDDDLEICRNECEFRSIVPCDQDVYDACVDIMSREDLEPATNLTEATDLYMFLRSELVS